MPRNAYDSMDYGEPEDKQWARKYILDPLTAPEPSQETGPGSSFFNPRRSLSLNHHQKKAPARLKSRRLSGYPTPPQSASPTRDGFHPTNPFSDPPRRKAPERVPDRAPSLPPFDWSLPASVPPNRRSNSFGSDSQGSSRNNPYTPKSPDLSDTKSPEARSPDGLPLRTQTKAPRRVSQKPGHFSPGRTSPEGPVLRRPSKIAHLSPERRSFERSPPARPAPHQGQLSPPAHSPERRPPVPEKDWRPISEQSSPEGYLNSSIRRSSSVRYPPQAHHTRGSADQVDSGQVLYRSSSMSGGLRRSNSINQRYPGDMSHRPLDMIKRDNRAADKAPHLHHKVAQVTDTIDSLDSSVVGGAYHHGGPYDATLASRNTNKLYSPVEALKESNNEAIKATPKEFITDSLTKHVPLQGTATVPPGMSDMGGRVMEYHEGADLMREADAPGGAYRRYDFIPYHPDDLKGKGEPSFTVERDLKEQKQRLRKHRGSVGSGSAVELQEHPRMRSSGASQRSSTGSQRKGGGVLVRQRSVSSAAADQAGPSTNGHLSPRSAEAPNAYSNSSDLQRRNTTGNRFAEGLKRRFGSLRRKVNQTDDV